MNLDDFRNIDFNNIGDLSFQVKSVLISILFFLTLILGYYFIWSPSIAEYDQAVSKEHDLRKVFLTKQNQAVNLPAYKNQMIEIERTFGTLLKQLPDKAKMDGLLMDINQAGLNQNLEFELFKPGQDTPSEFYAEMPIDIEVLGTYHEIGAFATSISNLSRIVTLNDIQILSDDSSKNSKSAKGSGLLRMIAVAKTYRYLDANEY